MKEMKKVEINTKDENNQEIHDFGYLVKKFTNNCCEVWCENLHTIMVLSQDDFFEIKENNE